LRGPSPQWESSSSTTPQRHGKINRSKSVHRFERIQESDS
jgi:hypothetical protein